MAKLIMLDQKRRSKKWRRRVKKAVPRLILFGLAVSHAYLLWKMYYG